MRHCIVGAAAVCLGLLPARAEPAERPNILLLFADDQRADTLAAYGNPHIKTPNLDRLAASGFNFRRAYCFGSNSGAVCVPSRAMLMTGKTWFRVDTGSLQGAKLLPELLQEYGYVTFGTGKWHNGRPSWLRAFQRGKSVFFGGMADHTKVPVEDLGPDGKLTGARTGEKFSSELFADAAIEFLRTYGGSRPFFLYVAFTAPHDPRMPPLPYREAYYRDPPPLPANFLPQFPFDNGMMRGGRDENLAPWPRTEAVIRDQLAEYYGLITHLDQQVGRILDALKQTGRADNTLIIYAADNGLALGSHGLLGKQSVFEHSMRVPLIIAGPGIPRGESTEAFAYLLDLFPTLCETIGIPSPADLDGKSLRPLWQKTKDRVRDTVFLPFMQIQRAVRDDRWKLICYPKISHMQLFDLQADPHETTNLIDRPDCAAQAKRLIGLMKQWQAAVGDAVELPLTNKPPEKVDLTGRPREPDPWQPEWIRKKYFDAPGAATAGRPNIVVFLTDDHGFRDSTVYGAANVRTPQMQRLAEAGLVFDRAFVTSPACAPSRAALLTGLMPARNGAMANHSRPRAALKKLPAFLQELGYEVVAFGKVAHYGQAKDYGFDHFAHDGFHDDEAVPAALQWLRGRTSRKPLALFVGTNWPHVPWPEEPQGYDPAQIQPPPTFVDTPATREALARYFAAVSRMDSELGQVFDAAQERLGPNTLFLTTSDNGAQFPFGKWNLYDAGTRTPLIAVWPGVIRPGTRTGAMVSWVDILPTLVELGGGSPPAGLDGRSFAAVLRGQKTTHRDLVFTTHSRDGDMNVYPCRAVRSAEWKYILNLQPDSWHTTHIDKGRARDGRAYWDSWVARARTDPGAAAIVARYRRRPAEELYDLRADPFEQRNLAGDPRHAETLARLRAELKAWMEAQGDEGLKTERQIAGGKAKTAAKPRQETTLP
ncbi:MAG: sulfatase-like hydrolase/transferase [Thermoguttaceae bacterium]